MKTHLCVIQGQIRAGLGVQMNGMLGWVEEGCSLPASASDRGSGARVMLAPMAPSVSGQGSWMTDQAQHLLIVPSCPWGPFLF
jgi:hypothetical protein